MIIPCVADRPNAKMRLNLTVKYFQLWSFGDPDDVEPCEEIRSAQVDLLKTTINNLEITNREKLVASWLSEIINILVVICADPYHEIRKSAMELVDDVITAVKPWFHLQAEPLLVPLLKSVSHQHSKVRIAAIKCLKSVVMSGGKTCLPDKIVSHFAQRMFDPHVNVRLAVVETAGEWLLKYDERYSFWALIMPLILTSLDDEYEEVSLEEFFYRFRVFESENCLQVVFCVF